MLLCIINPSSHSALYPTLYIPTSVVSDGARDIGAMVISLLHDSMVSDRYTLWIIAYFSKTLIFSYLRGISIYRKL